MLLLIIKESGGYLAYHSNDVLTWHQHKANVKRWWRLHVGPRDEMVLATYILLVINLVIYGLETWSQLQWGGFFNINSEVLVRYGASYPPLINDGEYWRLWTPMFVHLSPIHMVMNMGTLWLVGRLVEQAVGPIRMVCVYVLCGLAGNLLSFMMLPNVVSAGASTSLFGLIVYAALLIRPARRQMIAVIGVNLLYNLMDREIDIFGHLGGLIGGIALALLFLDVAEFSAMRVPAWVRSTMAVGLTGCLLGLTIICSY